MSKNKYHRNVLKYSKLRKVCFITYLIIEIYFLYLHMLNFEINNTVVNDNEVNNFNLLSKLVLFVFDKTDANKIALLNLLMQFAKKYNLNIRHSNTIYSDKEIIKICTNIENYGAIYSIPKLINYMKKYK